MAKDPRTKMIDFFNSKASKKYTEISRKLIREVQSGFKNLGKAEELSLEWKNVIAENSKVFPPGYQRLGRKTHKKVTRAIDLLEGAYLDLAMITEEEDKYRK